ncbi:MAG: HD family phosphohydrolase [Fusobacteriaceae bacterium]
MKKIEFLGFQYNYELKRKSFNEEDFYSNESMLSKKVFYILILIATIIFSNNIKLFYENVTYNIGDVAKTDIYSPKTVIFRDEVAKNKIIEQILNNFGKEYLFVAGAEEHYISSFKSFISVMKNYKKSKDKEDIDKYEREMGIEIPEQVILKYSKLSDKELDLKEKDITKLLGSIYEKGVFKEKTTLIINEDIKKNFEQEYTKIDRALINLFIAPNYLLDREKTEKSIKEKISQIKGRKNKINAGDLVIKKGTILTENDIKYLDIIGVYSFKHIIVLVLVNFIYLTIVSSMFYYTNIKLHKSDILNRNKYKTILFLITIVTVCARFINPQHIYLLPLDAFIFLILILLGNKFAFSIGMFTCMYLLPLIDYDLKFFTINMFSLFVISFLVRKLKTRIEVVHIGIQLAVLKATLYMITSYFLNEFYSETLVRSIEMLASGIFSGMLTIAFLPYFERTFNLLTVFKLLELGDLSNPLLKEFSVEAPGSFQHSLMVATLSENAAEKIHADSIFCRVASYYHDVGKLKRAKYYVENQFSNENPHDYISPFMSATIIKAHTKDGIEIAKKYQIPKEIRDVMKEHQGTTLLAYFYNKAKQLDSSVKIDDFKYLGPVPKSKESGIIMLADSIEAAVRSIDNKTQEKIEKMIRKIINTKIEDRQLVNAELTFREIEIIIESFKKTLASMHHIRVKYPDQK